MRSLRLIAIPIAATVLLSAAPADAAPPRESPRAPALHPLAPIANQTELGLYGGLMLPDRDHSFFGTQWRPLRSVVGSLGARIGYYPLRWAGFEAEAGGFPGFLKDGRYFNTFAVRGHAVFQLPYRVSPFLLGGVGMLMVRTPNDVLGTDRDPAMHLGLGLKVGLLHWLRLRVEWRATLTNDRAGSGRGVAMNNELLLGVTFAFGPRPAPAARPDPRPDRDGDGVLDAADRCPQIAGPAPDGCPPPAEEKPVVDTDGDRVADGLDRCPEQPEERNGFDDEDGCPDTLPGAIRRCTGALEGVAFATDDSTLDAASHPALDEIVALLQTYPGVRIGIIGHADDRGGEEHNEGLSRRRAEGVRDYLVAHGIAPERLTVRGAGVDQPITGHHTPEGRAANRRIELVLLTE